MDGWFKDLALGYSLGRMQGRGATQILLTEIADWSPVDLVWTQGSFIRAVYCSAAQDETTPDGRREACKACTPKCDRCISLRYPAQTHNN